MRAAEFRFVKSMPRIELGHGVAAHAPARLQNEATSRGGRPAFAPVTDGHSPGLELAASVGGATPQSGPTLSRAGLGCVAHDRRGHVPVWLGVRRTLRVKPRLVLQPFAGLNSRTRPRLLMLQMTWPSATRSKPPASSSSTRMAEGREYDSKSPLNLMSARCGTINRSPCQPGPRLGGIAQFATIEPRRLG